MKELRFGKHGVKNNNLEYIWESANLQTNSANILGATDLEVTEASCSKALVLLLGVILIQSLMKPNLAFPEEELMICIQPFIKLYAQWVTASEQGVGDIDIKSTIIESENNLGWKASLKSLLKAGSIHNKFR